MTEKEINKLIKDKATKKCPSCCFELPVTDFYIKKSKNPNYFRFNSPCKSCSNINRNINYQKAYHRKMKYNITQEEYDNMMFKQNFSCKICGMHKDDLNKELSVDHDHNTGKIRDLLCQHCNTMLGMGRESINIFKSAISYIKKHKKD